MFRYGLSNTCADLKKVKWVSKDDAVEAIFEYKLYESRSLPLNKVMRQFVVRDNGAQWSVASGKWRHLLTAINKATWLCNRALATTGCCYKALPSVKESLCRHVITTVIGQQPPSQYHEILQLYSGQHELLEARSVEWPSRRRRRSTPARTQWPSGLVAFAANNKSANTDDWIHTSKLNESHNCYIEAARQEVHHTDTNHGERKSNEYSVWWKIPHPQNISVYPAVGVVNRLTQQ